MGNPLGEVPENPEVRLLPLLIGPSDTLTKAMPEAAKKLSSLEARMILLIRIFRTLFAYYFAM